MILDERVLASFAIDSIATLCPMFDVVWSCVVSNLIIAPATPGSVPSEAFAAIDCRTNVLLPLTTADSDVGVPPTISVPNVGLVKPDTAGLLPAPTYSLIRYAPHLVSSA